jgi:hypothetical protein
MNELVETHPGSWILVAGSRAIRITMLTFIARLAERGPVHVLDGGNQFNAYLVARQVQGRTDLLERISISRAFTCYQVLASLEKTVGQMAPFIVLDFLHTFYDESVPFPERRRLLERCLPQLGRLTSQAGGAISIQPPAVASADAESFFATLTSVAPETWVQELPAPTPEPLRLF